MSRSLAAAAAALLVLAAPAAGRSALCQDRPGQTAFADRHMRIYATLAGSGDETTLRVFACVPGRRSARLLERRDNNLDETSRVVSAARAGRFPVVEYTVEGGVSEDEQLVEYGARSATRVARIALEPNPDGTLAATYVATRGGGIAVLWRGEHGAQAIGFDGAGRRVLSTAAATDLAAAGRHVYWTQGGTAMSEILSGHPHGDLSVS